MRRYTATVLVAGMLLTMPVRAHAVGATGTQDLLNWLVEKVKGIERYTESYTLYLNMYETIEFYKLIKEQSQRYMELVEEMKGLVPNASIEIKVSDVVASWFPDHGRFQATLNAMDGGLTFEFDVELDHRVTEDGYEQFEAAFSKGAYSGTWDSASCVAASKWLRTYDWAVELPDGRSEEFVLAEETQEQLRDVERQLSLQKSMTVGLLGSVAGARAAEEWNAEAKAKVKELISGSPKHLASLDTMKAELQLLNAAVEEQNELLRHEIMLRQSSADLMRDAAGRTWNATPAKLRATKTWASNQTAATETAKLTVSED